MSRFEITTTTPRHICFAYGLDHVTSVFVSVYDLSVDEDEDHYRILDVNNLGVEYYEPALGKALPVVKDFERRFEIARERGIHYPNLSHSDVIALARAFDIPIDANFHQQLYRNLD